MLSPPEPGIIDCNAQVIVRVNNLCAGKAWNTTPDADNKSCGSGKLPGCAQSKTKWVEISADVIHIHLF